MPAAPPVAHGLLGYYASKAAEVSIAQRAAVSLAPRGVGVSLLFPDKMFTEGVEELEGTATAESGFDKEEFMKFMGETGRDTAEVAEQFVEGVVEGRFFVSAVEGLEAAMGEWVKCGLDPNVVFKDG